MDESTKKIAMIIVSAVFIAIMAISLTYNHINSKVTQSMQESIRSAAIANVNNRSRINPGEVIIDKQGFENDFYRLLENGGGSSLKEEAALTFDYLESNDSESIKGIRAVLSIKEPFEKIYTATMVVDTSDGKWIEVEKLEEGD